MECELYLNKAVNKHIFLWEKMSLRDLGLSLFSIFSYDLSS